MEQKPNTNLYNYYGSIFIIKNDLNNKVFFRRPMIYIYIYIVSNENDKSSLKRIEVKIFMINQIDKSSNYKKWHQIWILSTTVKSPFSLS
jgi:hypothetical protein